MRFHSNFSPKKTSEQNRISYLIALILLFSYAEMLLPRFVPFFRLGLSNIAVLSSFNLSFSSFLLLTVFKALTTSLMSGTLFSPFAVISLFQSVLSGILMFSLFHLNNFSGKKLFSLYGISILGSSVSAVVQIFLSALYLGKGTFLILGPMLIFNTASGIFTAFLAQFLEIPEEAPALNKHNGGSLPLGRTSLRPTPSEGSNAALNACSKKSTRFLNILKILVVLALSAAVFFINSIPILLAFFALSLLLQFLVGRKIMIFPHIFLWIFVIISTLLVPSGKVFFQIGSFSLTQDALFNGIAKALRLSAASAFSQCAANLNVPEKNLLGQTLSYYRALLKLLKDAPGNIFHRLKTTLCATELDCE